MKSPSFIILGCPKCGTTSLHNYLSYHPHIHMSDRKELNYFSRGYKRKTWEWYLSWFKEGFDVQGESTPKYFYDFTAISNIKKDIPDAKLIVLLRNPIDRAYSNYQWVWHTDKDRFQELGQTKNWSFEEVIRNELKNFDSMWPSIVKDINNGDYSFYFSRYCQLFKGYYSFFLDKWYRVFGREQILVIRSEDLFNTTQEVYDTVCEFIGAEKFILSKKQKCNIGVTKKYSGFQSDLRKELEGYYSNKNKELYSLINRDMEWV